MTEEQNKNQKQSTNDGITNYEVQIGKCAQCNAPVYAPAKWWDIGERPVRRTCAHVGRILRNLDELDKNKKMFKQAGW